jgi:Flp pilus assembly protein TadD
MRTLLALSVAAALAGCSRPRTAPEPPPATAAAAPAATAEATPPEPQPQPAPPSAPMPAPAAAPAPEAVFAPVVDVVGTLREANAAAAKGQLDEANRLYASVVDAPNVSRDAIISAATGLYRTGDFIDAVRAFARLGTFARGEEDLRYYNAVALFETGRYAEAKKELACALPYIDLTSDVARYRAKIEGK